MSYTAGKYSNVILFLMYYYHIIVYSSMFSVSGLSWLTSASTHSKLFQLLFGTSEKTEIRTLALQYNRFVTDQNLS